ncbi:MAG TPA: hypothetical protein VGC06_13525, partial [Actinomycetes bacterium]
MSLGQFVSFPPGSTALDVPVTVGDRLGGGGTIATVGGARSMVAQADVGQQDVVQLKTDQVGGGQTNQGQGGPFGGGAGFLFGGGAGRG